jgi:hypothetical protein
MSFRRNNERVKADKRWQSFCQANQELIQQIGLAPGLYETAQYFGIFLEHGHTHPNEPISFDVNELTPSQYQALYELVDRYFVARYCASISSFVALEEDDVKKLALKYPAQLTEPTTA